MVDESGKDSGGKERKEGKKVSFEGRRAEVEREADELTLLPNLLHPR